MLKKLTDDQIEHLAKFGAEVSRHCRNCWTGEQTRGSLPFDKFTGQGGRNEASALEYLRLMALEDVADLQQYRLGKYGQHSWNKKRWEIEIRKRL